jgi:glycosyltransferase involved in cell wall biosynthesis
MDMKIVEPLRNVRIARISTVPFFIVTQLKRQIEMICNRGANVTVVSSGGLELEILKDVKNVEIDISRSISPIRDLMALFRLFLFFKCERIQIAHSTTPKAGLLTALAAFFAGVPVRLHTFTGQPWVNMHGLKKWLACNSDRLIGKLNTRCYADSASQQKFLIDQRILDSERIFVIGAGSIAGVDLCRFNRNRFPIDDCKLLRHTLNIQDGAAVLLFVGRITVDKGVRELLQAFELLKAAGSNAHLIMVGQFDVDSGVSGSIARDVIERIGDTHIVGYTDCPEAFMAIADVLCLPSYREGFGTVVIEAAAMGVPTVGTDIYGLSDAVINGVTGILVSPRDVKSLKDALWELLESKERCSKMGNAAKQRAEKLFDAIKINEKVIDEYQELLSGKY